MQRFAFVPAVWVVASWLMSAGAGVAAEGARLIGEDRRTAQRFAEAAAFERDARWPAAVDLYQRILEENGNDLIATDASAEQLLPARWVVHRRIASRPEMLAKFRERVDEPARRRLETAVAARDPRLLEQLIESMFCAAATESALHLVGDLACERGD